MHLFQRGEQSPPFVDVAGLRCVHHLQVPDSLVREPEAPAIGCRLGGAVCLGAFDQAPQLAERAVAFLDAQVDHSFPRLTGRRDDDESGRRHGRGSRRLRPRPLRARASAAAQASPWSTRTPCPSRASSRPRACSPCAAQLSPPGVVNGAADAVLAPVHLRGLRPFASRKATWRSPESSSASDELVERGLRSSPRQPGAREPAVPVTRRSVERLRRDRADTGPHPRHAGARVERL